MKKIILDTSFILSCVENKIDFIEEIYLMGYEVIVPEQVFFELKKIIVSEKKLKLREKSEITLKILNNSKIKKIDLIVTFVDKGLVKYLKDKPEIILATLDNELKKKVKNRKMIIRGQKQLEII